jgi:dTDP-4-dehydrorhamnose reductase
MRLLLTGASGQLGSYVLRECTRQSIAVVAWSGSRRADLFGYPLHPVDLTDKDGVAEAFRSAAPTAILHTAALARASDCRREPQRAEQINVHGTVLLAELAERASVPLLYLSTDMVYDGQHAPYREEDAVSPLSVYGRTKAESERAVLASLRHTVVRLPLLFGPSLTERPNFFDAQVKALRSCEPIGLFYDEWRTPLSFLVAARALLALAPSPPGGLLHVGGPERLSRFEMGQRLADFLGYSCKALEAISRNHSPDVEPRPADLSLNSSRWRGLYPHLEWPTYEEALSQFSFADTEENIT